MFLGKRCLPCCTRLRGHTEYRPDLSRRAIRPTHYLAGCSTTKTRTFGTRKLCFVKQENRVTYGLMELAFPFTPNTLQKCSSRFTDVKKRLQQLQATYTMLFHARHRITARGQAHFFESAADTSSWLNAIENVLRQARRGQWRKTDTTFPWITKLSFHLLGWGN